MYEKERKFRVWRVVLLIVLPMLFFNIGMSIMQGTLWGSLIEGELLELLTTLLGMSVLGLLLTPASFVLIVFAVVVETMYLKEKISQYWLFCISAGTIGLALYFTVFLLAGAEMKDFDLGQIFLIFIIHTLAAMLVYGRNWIHVSRNSTVEP